jgi:hypothetical protein
LQAVSFGPFISLQKGFLGLFYSCSLKKSRQIRGLQRPALQQTSMRSAHGQTFGRLKRTWALFQLPGGYQAKTAAVPHKIGEKGRFFTKAPSAA